MVSEDDEAGDAPEFLRCGHVGMGAIVADGIDAREFFLGTVLAPAYGLVVGVDEDALRTAGAHELFLLAAISNGSFGASTEPFFFGERAEAMEVHTLAVVPAVTLGEEFYEVGPGILR